MLECRPTEYVVQRRQTFLPWRYGRARPRALRHAFQGSLVQPPARPTACRYGLPWADYTGGRGRMPPALPGKTPALPQRRQRLVDIGGVREQRIRVIRGSAPAGVRRWPSPPGEPVARRLRRNRRTWDGATTSTVFTHSASTRGPRAESGKTINVGIIPESFCKSPGDVACDLRGIRRGEAAVTVA